LLLCVYYKNVAKAKPKLRPLLECSFAFVCILQKRLQKQKQNFALYRSTVLLLYEYYKNACKSKSKTLPTTGVQFCFCIYTTKTLAKAKAKLCQLLECSFAFVRILQKRLHKQEQNCAPTRENDLQIAAIGSSERKKTKNLN
jgi:hypothetical protein